MIMQRIGAGFVTSSSNYWDSSVDAPIVVQWPKDVKKDAQSKLVRSIVIIYAISF